MKNIKMSDSAMASISEFDSEDVGSNPTLTTMDNSSTVERRFVKLIVES
jgi:hypothetical protein